MSAWRVRALPIVTRVLTYPSIFSLFITALLISPNIISHLLVLLEQEPEHAIELLVRLNLNFRVRAYRAEFLFQVDDPLDVMLLELSLVRHDVVVSADEVLLQLIVKGLTTDLNADTKHDLNVNDLLLQGRLQDTQMPLS